MGYLRDKIMTDCKLCGRSEISKITAAAKTYYHCAYCSLIFIDEIGLPGPEAERKRYLEHHNTHENDGYVKMLTEFLNHLVTPYLQNIYTALDFGCGPAPVLADLLAKRGLTADVYDPYFYPETTYKMKSYDLITATEVFEHLSHPYRELGTLKNHLNADGYLAVRTMFHPGPEKFAGWWYHRDPTHVCFYDSDTFDWIAAHFALRIVFRDGKKFCLFQNGGDSSS